MRNAEERKVQVFCETFWGSVTKVWVTYKVFCCCCCVFCFLLNKSQFGMEIVFERQFACVFCPSTARDCRQLCEDGVSEAGTADPPWKRECPLVFCAPASELRSQPLGQNHLSYLPLFFVICARFAASGNQKLIGKIKLEDMKETMVIRKSIFMTLSVPSLKV